MGEILRVKNERPNVLVLAKPDLVIRGGQEIDVADSPAIRSAIDRGLLVIVEPGENQNAASAIPTLDLSALGWSEAADAVQELDDLSTLEQLAKTESRRTVQDAIQKRMRELSDDDR